VCNTLRNRAPGDDTFTSSSSIRRFVVLGILKKIPKLFMMEQVLQNSLIFYKM
jgi:hypothetical protein